MSQQYGTRGYTSRRPGCFAKFGFLFISIPVTFLAVVLYNGALGWHGAGLVIAAIVTFVLISWVLGSMFEGATTRRAWVCPACGSQTDPRFPICPACGSEKF